MRKVLVVLSLGVLGAILAAIEGGCTSHGWHSCEGDDCPPEESQCDGVCVPYMDATWDMALVGMAPESRIPLHCPATAPFSGMSGKEIPDSRRPARDVLACSVNPQPTCASDA